MRHNNSEGTAVINSNIMALKVTRRAASGGVTRQVIGEHWYQANVQNGKGRARTLLGRKPE